MRVLWNAAIFHSSRSRTSTAVASARNPARHGPVTTEDLGGEVHDVHVAPIRRSLTTVNVLVLPR